MGGPDSATVLDREKWELEAFLKGLDPIADAFDLAQKLVDRHAATTFSAFSYFPAKEIRLSAMLADLLRPNGSHGQGQVFLELFLKEIDRAGRKEIRKTREYGPLDCAEVATEHWTGGRSIDITLRVGDSWIAIENKPWAGEQEDQVDAYLSYVQEQRDCNACVIFLSGTGQDATTKPSDDRFYLTMPYRSDSSESIPSVEHWINESMKACVADNVRWFLKELTVFIQCQFTERQESSQEEDGE